MTVFQTPSHNVDSDCLLDRDPHDESSTLENNGDSTTQQLVTDHSVNCPVSEKGDSGGNVLLVHQLSQDSDVHRVTTCPSSAEKSVEQVLTVTDQPLKGPDGSGDGVMITKFETRGSCSNMAGIEVQNHGEEEQTFVPKPPDESAVPRRNSITRRGSLRRRAYSGSSPHNESKDSNKTGAGSQKMSAANSLDSSQATDSDQTAKNASLISASDAVGTLSSQSSPEDLVRARGRESTPSVRRSSSLGAVMREACNLKDRTTVAVKPPLGRQDGSTDPHDSLPYTEDTLARKHVDAKATLKNSSPPSSIPQPKQDNSIVHKMKKPFTHKRYF